MNSFQDNAYDRNQIAAQINLNLNFDTICFLYQNDEKQMKENALMLLKEAETFLWKFEKKIKNQKIEWIYKKKVKS